MKKWGDDINEKRIQVRVGAAMAKEFHERTEKVKKELSDLEEDLADNKDRITKIDDELEILEENPAIDASKIVGAYISHFGNALDPTFRAF